MHIIFGERSFSTNKRRENLLREERIFSGKRESSPGRENLLREERDSSQLFHTNTQTSNTSHHLSNQNTHPTSQSMLYIPNSPQSQEEEIELWKNLLSQGKKGEACLIEMVMIFNERFTSAQTNHQQTIVESNNASQAVSDSKKNQTKHNTEWLVAKEDILGLSSTISRFQRKVKLAEQKWLYAGTPHSAFESKDASALDVIHKKVELDATQYEVMKLQKEKIVAIAERDLAMSNKMAAHKAYTYHLTWARCAKHKQALADFAMETAKEDSLLYKTVLNEHTKHPPSKTWRRRWPSQSRGGRKVQHRQSIRLNVKCV